MAPAGRRRREQAGERLSPGVPDALRLFGWYYLITGIWPVVHLRSFEALTGPKRDGWLVRTFGLLVSAIGLSVLLARGPGERRAQRRLAVGSAAALTLADVVFVARGRIRPVYLLDALVEVGLAAAIARDPD